MLIMFAQRPNRNNAETNWVTVAELASSTSVSGYSTAENSITDFVPYFDDNHADNGKLTNCPAGSAKRTNPNAASVKCNAFFMSGIRLAQVENVSPATKKKALTAILYIRGCITNVVFII